MSERMESSIVRLAALFSGGKDSTYAAYLMEQQGHCVDILVSVLPSDPHSWMFHTPNLHILPMIAESMKKELVTEPSTGSEESDLYALSRALSGLEVDGVIAGAIASDYQWDRINGVCEDLGLRTFAPLWRKNQEMLLREIAHCGIKAMVVGVFAEGLDERWLGTVIDSDSINRLKELAIIRGINISGEGGEFETLVVDSPMHAAPLEIVEFDRNKARDGGSLHIRHARLGRR